MRVENRVGKHRLASASLVDCFWCSRLISLILVFSSRMKVCETYLEVIVVKGSPGYLAHSLHLVSSSLGKMNLVSSSLTKHQLFFCIPTQWAGLYILTHSSAFSDSSET